MKIGLWNIRGMNKLIKQQEVISLFNKCALDILCVVETRVRVNKCAPIQRKNFKQFLIQDNYSSHYNGRIWVLWRNSAFLIQCLNSSSQWIHLLVSHGRVQLEVTFVYGFNHLAQRLPLWDFIVSNVHCSGPWLVIGDINCVRNSEERVSSDSPQIQAMEEFNQAIADSGLEEIRTQGCWFTWTNKQEQADTKWMRLDRALANALFFREYPDSLVDVSTAGISDHSPLVLSLGLSEPPRRHSFKYLNCWSEDMGFQALVQREWGTSIKGCGMYQLVQHLRRLKGKFRYLHKSRYVGVSEKVKLLQQQLHRCQEKLQHAPTNSDLCLEDEELRQQYCKFRKVELSIAYQRAEAFEVKMGDTSTAYFFSKIAGRRNQSNISKVLDTQGAAHIDQQGIATAFLDYYIGLLGTDVAVQDFDDTIMRNGHWVEAALFSIDPKKSPCPDGYSSGFFRDAWPVIQGSFTSAIQDFFATGKLLKEINSTLISLIPKGNSPSTVLDYRPISCCSTI
ncbi:uncharacterized protein LOC141630500 [Silene latifolia]|uniref:uncharacterized protein LOC141630500 n=1 Tax=Silene latifolia TaxID=37657 RepID=UPI003D76C956